ncbi:MAG: hypothetical protein ACI9EF_000818 [Pseudohongiellaceae bacterium]|jgi:hypothetical protein
MRLPSLSGSRLPWPLVLLTVLTSAALICVGSLEWPPLAKVVTAALTACTLLAAFGHVPRLQLQRQLLLRRQAECLIERQAEALRAAHPQTHPQHVAQGRTRQRHTGKRRLSRQL